MSQRVRLSRITIFPIKSLPGISVQEATIKNGKLVGDREFAFFDHNGNYLNGKRYPEIFTIRAQYHDGYAAVTLSHPDYGSVTAALPEQGDQLAEWMSIVFAQPVTFAHDQAGFPDDTAAPGPTIIGSGSLRSLAQHFQLPEDNIRRRFRMNLELSFPNPLEEDQLVDTSFRIGAATFVGVRICTRCSVPIRDPDTGTPLPNFRQQFLQWRTNHSHSRSHLDHLYKLGINTCCPASSKLRIGDVFSLL